MSDSRLKTRKSNRIKNKIARAAIWIAACTTILLLFWVIGYILYKGFYYDVEKVSDFINIKENEIPLPQTEENAIFIINKSINTDELNINDLRTIYTKMRIQNWGFYTQQDINSFPVSIATNKSDFSQAMAFYLAENDYSRNVNFARNYDELVDMVKENKGGIGFVPSSYKNKLKGVKTLKIRRFTTICHPSVVEIVNNVKLQELTEDQLWSILNGEVRNWKEVRGIDLAIKLERGDYSPLIFTQLKSKLNDNALFLQKDKLNNEQLIKTVSNTPGAISISDVDVARRGAFPQLHLVEHKSGINLTFDFLFQHPSRSGKWGGISVIIINTLILILFTLVFSTPIGVMAAIYLVEYAKQGRLIQILKMGTDTLAGIPSIVFGLFGFIFFAQICGFGLGFLTATLSITIMILPTIVRTSVEALKTVPESYREGSLALGATNLTTIFRVVLPAASPGILTGVILSIGRVVGETAVLLYTLGSNYELATSPFSSARVLSLHLYILFSEAISFEKAFATGAVLLFIVLLVNILTTSVIGRLNKFAGK